MEEKVQNAFLFFLLVIFLFVSTASSDPFHSPTQTLVTWLESKSIESDPGVSNTLSLPLYHVDALFSNKTPEQLFHLRLQRDAARVKTFTSMAAAAAKAHSKTRSGVSGPGSGFSSPVTSGLAQGTGEYFVRIGVGTPPRHVNMVLDTGSDITWLQCAPCTNCYNQTDPIFDPRNSTSFAGIPCKSPLCQLLSPTECKKNVCQYQVTYGDGSVTTGDFSTETLTFGRTSLERVAIGCGHENSGIFVPAATGLLAIGGGSLSLLGQTESRLNKKFSYCLVDRLSNKSSSIIFGDLAIPRTAQFTPLLKNPKTDKFYYVELLSISVGGVPVHGVSASQFKLGPDGDGGIIIDSGTTVTTLTSPAYLAFRNAFRNATTHLKHATPVLFSPFDTCYNVSGLAEAKVPTVVFHFRDANVSLPATNILVPMKRNGSGPFCFAFTKTTYALSIIGNIQQQGIRVAYDLAGSRVGFTPGECL